ncbi:MAG TPA: RNA methyltransferase [Acidimicrobiia bacterium]|nr:RNA methyltransferase [Acidimicrobiia bacterium]
MRTFISDPEDKRLADYRHLADPARRADRDPGGAFFIVEGWEAVVRLLGTDWDIRSVLLAEDKSRRLSVPPSVTTYLAPRAVLETTVGFQLHRGVVAAVNRRPFESLETVAGAARTLAVLEGLNDHENLGAIFRSAAALGIDGIILDPTCADPFYRRSIRVSIGTVLTMPVARADDLDSALGVLEAGGFSLLAFTPDPGATSIDNLGVVEKAAIILGSEASGLSPEVRGRAAMQLRIPQRPGINSLNVGHTAAIAFYRLGHV